MNEIKNLRWPLILGLGTLALVRPLVNIVEYVLGVEDPPAVSIVLTLVISAIWIAVVGLGRVGQPVLTLVMVGVTYAVLTTIASGILSPILTGELQGPLAMPLAIIPLLLINAFWGLVTGALALLVQRTRGGRPVGHPRVR